jgi:hypothetical protein
VAQAAHGGMTPEQFAKAYELSVDHVRAALACAAAFLEEIEGDCAQTEANRAWLENQQAADFAPRKTRRQAEGREPKHKNGSPNTWKWAVGPTFQTSSEPRENRKV